MGDLEDIPELTNPEGARCDFCDRFTHEPMIRIEIPISSEYPALCSWPCVAGFAATRAREYEDRLQSLIDARNRPPKYGFVPHK